MTDAPAPPAADLVELIPNLPPGANWQPVQGRETRELLQNLRRLDARGRERLLNEAAAALSRCVSPQSPNDSQTGLVIGNIQSGKTMSFTTVAALARDNAYRLIIVITGISRPLFGQSTTRLRRDLRLETRP